MSRVVAMIVLSVQCSVFVGSGSAARPRRMDKILRCSDIVLDCDAVVRGSSDEEILRRAPV